MHTRLRALSQFVTLPALDAGDFVELILLYLWQVGIYCFTTYRYFYIPQDSNRLSPQSKRHLERKVIYETVI